MQMPSKSMRKTLQKPLWVSWGTTWTNQKEESSFFESVIGILVLVNTFRIPRCRRANMLWLVWDQFLVELTQILAGCVYSIRSFHCTQQQLPIGPGYGIFFLHFGALAELWRPCFGWTLAESDTWLGRRFLLDVIFSMSPKVTSNSP